MEFPTYAVLSIIEWKTHFYLFAIKPGYCELKLTKKRFRLLVSKIRYFQLYCTKNMCSLIFCKIALFPALLQREKMFCKAATSHGDFYLKQRFGLFLARFCYFHHHLSVSSLFVTKLHFWRSILPKECFGLLATQLSCFEPYVTKKMFLPFCVENTLRVALLQEKHVLVSLWYKWVVLSVTATEKGCLPVCSEFLWF